MFEYEYTPGNALHVFPIIDKFGGWGKNGVVNVMYDVRTYSFVSCYKISSTSGMLSSLTSPFDEATWVALVACFAIVVLILTALHRTALSSGVMQIVGMT